MALVAFSSKEIVMTETSSQGPKARVVIGKPGLDGHDRGAKYVARILRDAGFEVIYTGIRRTPEQIVETAVQEDAAAIGLSLLSGAHNVLFPRVIELLHAKGADDILVFGGGTIPPDDIPGLKKAGVAAIFTPGAPAATIVKTLRELLDQRAKASAA
jgi:methylmalonyl-CoA mutase C-terminal domain/subunit